MIYARCRCGGAFIFHSLSELMTPSPVTSASYRRYHGLATITRSWRACDAAARRRLSGQLPGHNESPRGATFSHRNYAAIWSRIDGAAHERDARRRHGHGAHQDGRRSGASFLPLVAIAAVGARADYSATICVAAFVACLDYCWFLDARADGRGPSAPRYTSSLNEFRDSEGSRQLTMRNTPDGRHAARVPRISRRE